ncbi:MAG: hypothetical protein ABIJ09_10085 [Pseudomonadota bacterium]
MARFTHLIRPPRAGRAFLHLVPWLACALTPAAQAQVPDAAQRLVGAARSLLTTPYRFGGRLRHATDGIDCQGVLFYAAEHVGACGWRSYSVYPSQAIPAGELGDAVPGLSPVRSSRLPIADLRPGDVLWLVGPARNPAEPAIGAFDDGPVWVWHTGIYSGHGQWIVGDHFAGQVVETDLASYLAVHADTYSGLVVTRLAPSPRPARCRHHARMGSSLTRATARP